MPFPRAGSRNRRADSALSKSRRVGMSYVSIWIWAFSMNRFPAIYFPFDRTAAGSRAGMNSLRIQRPFRWRSSPCVKPLVWGTCGRDSGDRKLIALPSPAGRNEASRPARRGENRIPEKNRDTRSRTMPRRGASFPVSFCVDSPCGSCRPRGRQECR